MVFSQQSAVCTVGGWELFLSMWSLTSSAVFVFLLYFSTIYYMNLAHVHVYVKDR